MEQITLKDILNLPPEQLIAKMSKREVIEIEIEPDPPTPAMRKIELKKKLKGFLKGNEDKLKKDTVMHVDDVFITITQILPFSGRVNLETSDGIKFSISQAFLLDESSLGVEIGDKVRYKGDLYVVEKVFISNKSLVLSRNGKLKNNVNIRRIEKVS